MIIVSRICCLSVCRSLFCGNQTKISMSAQDGADETALERTFRWHIGLLTPAMKCCNLRSVSNSSCKANRRTIASGDYQLYHVSPSVCFTTIRTGWIFVKIRIWNFFTGICRLRFSVKSYKKYQTLHADT
jgi:hypothetical protein